MMEELLPEIINVEFDLTDLDNLDYDQEVQTCKNLFKTIRDGGIDVLIRLLRVHEALVHKKLPGKTWAGFCKDLGIDRHTPIRWFQKHGLPYSQTAGTKKGATAPSHKPARKHTKPAVKNQLEEVAKEIEAGGISDDDIREHLTKPVAKAIKEGKADVRAGTPVQTAIKQAFQRQGSGVRTRKQSEVETLCRSMEKNADQLRYLVDGNMKVLKTDTIHLETLKRLGPGYIYSFAKLGIDPRKVYDFFLAPRKGEDDEKPRSPWPEDQSADAIDVEYKVVPPEQEQPGLWPQL
jgi:hypothetical protein